LVVSSLWSIVVFSGLRVFFCKSTDSYRTQHPAFIFHPSY